VGFFVFRVLFCRQGFSGPQTEASEQARLHMPETEKSLSLSERELLNEVLRALRGLRYGSIVLTVHEGRLVEIQKTERIRRNAHGEVA
jgi:hypothetical protein